MSEHLCVTAVVLGTSNREAITEAIELLGIEREDLKAPLQQQFDQRPARRLDRDRDLARGCSRRLLQPDAKLVQCRAFMAHVAFAHAIAFRIEQADAMALARPVDPDKPTKFIHRFSSMCCEPHRDVRRSLYWRSRRVLLLDIVAATPPGHMSYVGALGTGGLGCSRRIGPWRQPNQGWCANKRKGTGRAKGAHAPC